MSDPATLLAKYHKLVTPAAARLMAKEPSVLQGIIRDLDSGLEYPFMIGEAELAPHTIGIQPEMQPPTPTPTLEPIVKPSDVRVHSFISRRTTPPAREYEGEVEVFYDPAEHLGAGAKVDDFHKLFQDRYRTLRDLLRRQYPHLYPLEDIGTLTPVDDKVNLVGMVQNIRTTKNGHTILDLEDPTGSVKVLLSKNKEISKTILVDDETVGIVGKFSRDDGRSSGIVFADDVLRPDIPEHQKARSAVKGELAAFISDIHVGSSHFLSRDWRKMVAWLNGEDTGTLDPAIPGRIKYLVISGDLVDGIGIYPEQEKDLDIKDISHQYEMLAEVLSKVPSHIHLILIPGNHDAVRLAEPQPALPREFTECFSNERVHFLTNPAYVSLSGVKVTAYHGKSIDDMVQLYKDVTYENPLEGMREMLRSRHLALTYGMRNQLSPQDQDMMVLREVPDILVTGHVHRFGISDYKGVCMIQAGTWQSQTSFQKMMNFKPQPARMGLVDLSSWEVSIWEPKGTST